MKFTLTFEGQIKTGKGNDAGRKQALRDYFHPQLRRLWKENKFINEWSRRTDEYFLQRMEDFVRESSPPVNGIQFVPLITRGACLDCWIDFSILRPSEKNPPDIDNQIKVLCDGLKMPRDVSEMGARGPEVPNPLYVLLQDNGLVSKLTSTQDEMLQPIGAGGEFNSRDAASFIQNLSMSMHVSARGMTKLAR